jgi:hypothetical protein
LIFPISMLIGILSGQINLFSLIAALVQYPLYVFLVMNLKSNKGKVIAIVVLTIIQVSCIMWVLQIKGERF